MGNRLGIAGAAGLDVQSGVMDNGLELLIGERSSNWVHYIHLHANALEKCMNPPPLPQLWIN